jgi:membrane fusion protein, macrolide-specific efflux system
MKLNEVSRFWKPGLVLLGLFVISKMMTSCFHSKDTLQVIRSVKVEKGDLEVTVTATGTIKPYNRVEVKPPIGGRVEEVLVEEGEKVDKGQTLAWMSSTERAALLDAARAQGEETFKRWEDSYKAAPILAPLDGMIIVRSVEPGQTVTTADPIVVISDRLIVQALVDETDLSLINLGQKTEIRLDAYPNQVFPGTVDHITYESQLVNNVNVYAIDILPGKIPPAFRSGMTANVTFIVAERKGVWLLPSEAVAEWPRDQKKPEGADFAVYKKSFGGELVPVAVRIGESDGRKTEIREGVKEGMEIQIVRKPQAAQAVNPFAPGGAPKRNEKKGNT